MAWTISGAFFMLFSAYCCCYQKWSHFGTVHFRLSPSLSVCSPALSLLAACYSLTFSFHIPHRVPTVLRLIFVFLKLEVSRVRVPYDCVSRRLPRRFFALRRVHDDGSENYCNTYYHKCGYFSIFQCFIDQHHKPRRAHEVY